jgi:CheY-like chemotaxis protein
MQDTRVTVIDYDEKYLGEIKKILLGGGYAPLLVVDPFLAVDTVKENKPDVILMELRMPRKNGFELTDAINRIFQTRRIPIIAMSRFFKKEFNWLLDLCGIKRWIKKPFQPLDVIWAIENEIDEGYRGVRERSLADREIIT